jgi:hypothetical protein
MIKIMLAAVDFDNQEGAHANKVYNVTLARRLPPEVEAALSPCAQMNPQLHLMRGHRFA